MTKTSEMEYKGYHAEYEFDQEDRIFVGHVLGLTDLLSFHGKTQEELQNSFQDCIENYLERCKLIGKELARD